MTTQAGLQYAVDLVLCIDKTGSMSPVLDMVKSAATRLRDDLTKKLAEKGRPISQLRIRVIAFGDLYADKDKWVRSSEFFKLPEQVDDFKSFLGKIVPEGGGDEPENGLEALSMAIKSPWTADGDRRRHVVVIWTDASAHKLEKQSDSTIEIDESLARSFDELTDLWNGQTIDSRARRLVMFAPEAYPWSDLGNFWDEAILLPTRAGEGMKEHEYNEILDLLANSI